VLFLDEPTTGLDPRSRLAVWDLIGELVTSGTTLLLTTQYLEEADRLADRISVIDSGRVIADGTSGELKARVGGERLEVTVVHEDDLHAARTLRPYAHGEGDVFVDADRRHASVTVAGGQRPLAAVVRDLVSSGVEVEDLDLRRPTLDDVFLALTGHAKQPTEDELGSSPLENRPEKEIA
jgi:ABC-2 type transport system ATP-binding protein